jgi:type IX secretion system PorP/SprF family membrane protein
LFARFILVSGVLLWGFDSLAQQDPMYTQYMENLQTVNPAYAGSKDLLSVMAVARNQWVSLPGAPDTRTLAAHTPISTTNMGLGFSLLSDKIGPVKQIGFYVDYSYRLNFSNNRTLALGLKAGVNFYDAGLADLTTNDPNDPVFANDINRNFLPNFGIGTFFYTNKYYIGLSIPKFIENTINENGITTQNTSREKMHVFFMSGYVFDVNRIVKFKPSILAKYVKNAPVSIDINGTVLFYDRLWLGTMLRIGDSVGGLFQIQVTNQIKIGYSYDLPISKLGAYSNGTHEFMISYDFNPRSGRIRSPRYF